MRRLIGVISLFFAAATICGCAEEYVAPTFPEGVIPTVSIAGTTEGDTGIFSAEVAGVAPQSFTLSVLTEGTIFPECSVDDVSVSISDATNFTLDYVNGAETFTVSAAAENETSLTVSATVTAMIDSAYGGSVSVLNLTQMQADIPYFTSQPRNVLFSSTQFGSVAYATFAIDPMDVTDITVDSFTVTSSSYYDVVITEESAYSYLIAFTATQAAVNALSGSEEDIVVNCTVTLTYNTTEVEISDSFTVTMNDN